MHRERFAALLQPLGPFLRSTHFAVALSGGADSLALTLLMQDYVARHGSHLTALTVDHRLRPESTEEALAVAQQMRACGIDHHILTPTHADVSNNLQETARAWRYAALSDYCLTHGILHCLVAHQAGDNRETVHHNMARGHTADGASGMRAVHNLHGVRFLRPLLDIERGELEEYLRSRNIDWIDDPSNTNQKFARVRTRQMLQHNAAKEAALDTTIDEQRTARTARDQAHADAAMRCVTVHPLGFADIDLTCWRTVDGALASQLLADCLTTISGATSRPRAGDTQRLVSALREVSFTTRTLQQCNLNIQGNHLRIARELSRVPAPILLRGSGEARWDGRFNIRYDLPAGTAYTLAALGITGRRMAKKQWGTKADMPPSSPALWHLDELMFLPHIELPHAAAQQVRIGFAPPKPLAAAPFW